MNILFLADNFPPEKNAQASRVYERACYWMRWGHPVSVLTSSPNFPEGKLYPGFKNRFKEVSELDGIRVVRVKTFIAANSGTVLRILDFLSFMLSAFLFGMAEAKPDVIAATSPQFFAAVAGWALSAFHRVPFVLEISDLWPDSIVATGAMKPSLALRYIEKLELFLYNHASRIVVLTNSFKTQLMSRGIPGSKIDVVINGVDLARYSPRALDRDFADSISLAPGDFVIGYAGTLGMAHGLSNVIEAAGLVTDPRVKFLLVGPGAEREQLISRVKELGLSNVVIAPSQPKDRMMNVWSVCDVSLVHLRNAHLFKTVIPSKIFEAMAMGLPILLACPEGEASAIIERERCGLAIPPEDPAALAASALRLFYNESERTQFAAASRAAAPSYSRERQARDMLTSLVVTTGGRADQAIAAKA